MAQIDLLNMQPESAIDSVFMLTLLTQLKAATRVENDLNVRWSGLLKQQRG
jgi:hypothetical protein